MLLDPMMKSKPHQGGRDECNKDSLGELPVRPACEDATRRLRQLAPVIPDHCQHGSELDEDLERFRLLAGKAQGLTRHDEMPRGRDRQELGQPLDDPQQHRDPEKAHSAAPPGLMRRPGPSLHRSSCPQSGHCVDPSYDSRSGFWCRILLPDFSFRTLKPSSRIHVDSSPRPGYVHGPMSSKFRELGHRHHHAHRCVRASRGMAGRHSR